MDTEWVVETLDAWITNASRTRQSAAYSSDPSPWALRYTREMDLLREREDQVARVIQVALGLPTSPTLLVVANTDEVEVQAGIDLAARARGRVLTGVETAAKLGSTAPTMSADALHPLVWSAASGRWESGHYSDAVQRAATALSGYVKDRTGRYELGDSQLILQAFSLEPPQQDRPRLRWPGNDEDLTVKSMREGILYMARGVFAAVRNPTSHSVDEMPKQDALEQLAALSVLARWIEQCEVVET